MPITNAPKKSEFQIWMDGFEDGMVSGFNSGFEEGKRWILRQLEDQKNIVPFQTKKEC